MTHFCTQKSCISKCLWWISCSNFEPFSRIFNAQTSTKTWVGTCAHKQQLLCHSSMNSYIYLWIPRDTHGFPQTPMESQGAMQISLALSLLCWCSVPVPDRCLGFRAGLQSQALSPELQNLPQDLSWSYDCKQLSVWGHKATSIQVISTDRIWV